MTAVFYGARIVKNDKMILTMIGFDEVSNIRGTSWDRGAQPSGKLNCKWRRQQRGVVNSKNFDDEPQVATLALPGEHCAR